MAHQYYLKTEQLIRGRPCHSMANALLTGMIPATRLMVVLSLLLSQSVVQAQWHESTASSMGTEIRVKLWAESKRQADSAMTSVIDEMHRIDHLMSSYDRTSELSRVNQNATNKEVETDPELFSLISKALEFSGLTHGAFDITYASIGYLYDYRQGKRPDKQSIKERIAAINYHHVMLNTNNNGVKFAHKNVRIDLGGIAKGYAVDKAIGLLKDQGIEHAMVTAGGDTRVLGDHRGRPWSIAIQDPRNSNKTVARIPLQAEAISTSGDYERFFDEEGIRYHHIINPQTGDSVRKVRSVSIIGPQSVTTDALSTSVFVMGVESGMNLINKLKDYEAIIVDGEQRLKYSAGLQKLH